MKARVKETGVVVEVQECNTIHKGMGYDYVSIHNGYVYKAEDLEIDLAPDYWTRLEHQAMIAAMQAQIAPECLDDPAGVACTAYAYAHALVEKAKKEKK